MCCWGWTIRIGGEIIKTDDAKLCEIIGFDVDEPIPVKIELGETNSQCSSYYKVKKIEIVK